MATTAKPLALIAQLYSISNHAAQVFTAKIQRLCKIAPSYACIAKACLELGKETSDIDIAIRASEIRGWASSNVNAASGSSKTLSVQSSEKSVKQSIPHQNKQSLERNTPKKALREEFHFYTIAELRRLSVEEAEKYVARIHRLCVTKPSVSAVAAACKQLVTGRYTDYELAVRASEIEGWSSKNVKLVSKSATSLGDSRTLQSGFATGRGASSIGLKEIGRMYSDTKSSGISDFGDWESD